MYQKVKLISFAHGFGSNALACCGSFGGRDTIERVSILEVKSD